MALLALQQEIQAGQEEDLEILHGDPPKCPRLVVPATDDPGSEEVAASLSQSLNSDGSPRMPQHRLNR